MRAMAVKPKPKPKVEDEAQSQRFIDMAHELEAEGDLVADSEAAFERTLDKIVPARKRAPEG